MTSCPRCQRVFATDSGVRFCPVDGSLVKPAVSDRNLGRLLLGQFEIREVCGRGAMGTVYLAYQRTMDRVVAVKILRPELENEPDVVRRFLREARAAAKLQHPNIVTVHMVGQTEDGLPFLVMEYVDGVSLEAICEAQGAQPIERVVALGRQIAIALAEAHHAGIVHRDLKPANILVTDRSRVPDQVKVLDFGIAKIVDHVGVDSIATRDGVIFGTPHYIAPEQATGGEIDRRADLYSLGVILFRMATGRLPFEGTQGMQVVLKHLRDAPPRPRELQPEIPASLETLILELLAKDRAHRPADAEAVGAALDRVGSGKVDAASTLAGMPSAPNLERPSREIETPRRGASRRVYVGALMAVALGALVGVLAAWAHNRVDAAPAFTVGPPPGERKSDPPSSAPALPPALFDEHDLKEDGLVLRAGFERAPAAGENATLMLTLLGTGTVAASALEITVESPSGGSKRVSAVPAPPESGRFRATFAWSGAGLHKLKVLAAVPGRVEPLELAFDVEASSAQPAGSPSRARGGERRLRAPELEEDLPMTVVPASAVPIVPRRLAGSPTPEAPPRSAPVPSPVKAAPSPPPDSPEPSEPPAATSPPSASDPTTLPPPSPPADDNH